MLVLTFSSLIHSPWLPDMIEYHMEKIIHLVHARISVKLIFLTLGTCTYHWVRKVDEMLVLRKMFRMY